MVKYAASTVLLVLLVLAHGLAWRDDMHTMAKERLRPLPGKPGVIVIDVRTNYDWATGKVRV